MNLWNPEDWGPADIWFNTDRHTYHFAGKTRPFIPGVTGILKKGHGAPHLVRWAARKAGERVSFERDKLLALLDLNEPELVTKWVSEASEVHSGRARDIGSNFHNIAEAMTLGRTPPAVEFDEVPPMVEQWQQWLKDFDVEILAAELGVWNPGFPYGGKFDAIARVPSVSDKPVMLDYKTGATGPHLDYVLQLSAYAYAPYIVDFENGQQAPMPDIDRSTAVVVKVRPESAKGFQPHQHLGDAFKVFGAAHTVAEWDKKYDRDAYQAPMVPPVTDDEASFARMVDEAATVQELRDVWAAAELVGKYSAELDALCKARVQELGA